MLVFVSDLHIGDRSTGVQHLSLGAFAEALPNIARQAQENGAREVAFVFLGDIFDLVRTKHWTKLKKDRPWDILPNPDINQPSPRPDPASGIARETEKVMRKILNRKGNREIFDLWKNPLCGRHTRRLDDGTVELLPVGTTEEGSRPIWPLDIEPKRIYIPGNHDRLVNEFQVCRELVVENLGLNLGQNADGSTVAPINPANLFEYRFTDSRYGVFARHGQEWDNYNFEFTTRWDENQLVPPDWKYLEIPIGELIAAEVASRLPRELYRMLRERGADPKLAKQAMEAIKTLDDVRPVTAILPWLLEKVRLDVREENQKLVLAALTDTIQAVIERFDQLPYTLAWAERHDTWRPFDYADNFESALFALQRLSAEKLNRLIHLSETDTAAAGAAILKLIPCLKDSFTSDNYASEAHKDLERVRKLENPGALYILYGHTHQAEQVPVTGATEEVGCGVYLNTGTWRPLARQAVDMKGFMRWKNLTYTIFYCGDVDKKSPEGLGKSKQPTFETWTGSLLGG